MPSLLFFKFLLWRGNWAYKWGCPFLPLLRRHCLLSLLHYFFSDEREGNDIRTVDLPPTTTYWTVPQDLPINLDRDDFSIRLVSVHGGVGNAAQDFQLIADDDPRAYNEKKNVNLHVLGQYFQSYTHTCFKLTVTFQEKIFIV